MYNRPNIPKAFTIPYILSPMRTYTFPFGRTTFWFSTVTTEGRLHVVQKGIRSGLAFFSIAEPAAGSIMYFQNLSALNSYCTDTGASMADVIAGDWPELGFALPPAEAPIKKGN